MIPLVRIRIPTRITLNSLMLAAALLASGAVFSPADHNLNGGQVNSSLAQEVSSADQEYNIDLRFEHIGILDGLSMSSVQSITQDQAGFLWIGTQAGLNKYDGYEISIREVNPGDPIALAGENISSLLADSQGNLWIGTDLGLERLQLASGEITQFRNIPNDRQSLTAGQVNAILEDTAGNIWIGTYYGLNRFEPQSETFTRFLPENLISDLYEDPSGTIWIASNLGLISWHPDRERFSIYLHDPDDPSSLTYSGITSIDKDGQGNLWVGTAHGLNLFDLSTGESKPYLRDPDISFSLGDNSITDVLHDSRGRTWISTINGLDLYDPGLDGFHHFRDDPAIASSLSDNFILGLYEDRSGVIWIGTYSGGLNKLSDDHNRFKLFPPIGSQSSLSADLRQDGLRESLHTSVINDLLQDRYGELWFGTILNGLYRIDDQTGLIKQFNFEADQPDSLSGDVINDIFEDRSGELWLGTNYGLDRFDRQTGTFESFPAFNAKGINSIAQDSAGDLWIASYQDLFRLFNQNGELLVEKKIFAVEEPRIYQLFFDSRGAFWIATINGIYVQFPGDQDFTHYSPEAGNPDSLKGHLVYSIFEDHRGVIWIGTILGGLNRFQPDTGNFISFTNQEGLPGNWVACILEDNQGALWLGTNRGLSRFDPASETFQNYDSQDGVAGGEFISCAKTVQGELFFGGFQGINAFYPGDITPNDDPPPVVITRFNLFNQLHSSDLQPDQQLALNYQENFISFDYAALDFNAPQDNQYAYMLEGLDQDWNQVGSRRHAEYPDLAPGEYTFRVKAANNDGVWNETGASVHISIQPPFWGTNWFQGFALLVLAGAGYGGYRLRVRGLQIRSRELEAEVAARTEALNERTREAEQRQAEIEALYRADEELYRYLQLEHVLNALMGTALEILDADKALLVVWDQDHNYLRVNTSIGYQLGSIRDLVINPGEGYFGTVALSGETTIVEHAAEDPGFPRQLVEDEQIHTSVLVPIKIDSEIFGVFSVDFINPHPVSHQEHRLMEALAQRTAVAIENARLYEQAQALAAMEERNRLARDLHDSVTQSLFGASMFADTAEHQLAVGAVEQAADTISKLQETTRIALREMRLMIYELRPPVLEEEGLAAALVSRLETVEQRAGLQTELNIDEIDGLTPNQEQQIYSIAIEAFNNILKHAQAEKISVSLTQDAGMIQMQIVDDGSGFDLDSAREGGGLGLIGMQERAAQLGAQLKIETNPGEGTCLQFTMEISP